jgi:hypothetical protein
MLLMNYGPEMVDASFYTPEFTTTTAKVVTQFLVLDNNAQIYTAHLQAWDVASESFVTVCSGVDVPTTTTNITLTDQDWESLPSRWAVFVTRRMRWWIELTGTGLVAMQVSAFELTSASDVSALDTVGGSPPIEL